MKIRDKKTGAIYKIEDIDLGNNADGIWLGMTKYNSLAELNAEWEDVPEEPKTFWYMTAWGDVKEYSQDQFAIKQKQEIGNYFETKEEAEKVVEKLKAWKRLTDKGFRFCGYTALGLAEIHFMVDWEDIDVEQHTKDLDLLFGGEE